jgi:uncharacterized protein YjbJ (UPF0337 family)
MTSDDGEDEVSEAPATWENVLVGKAKEAVGHVLGKQDLVEDGEDEVEGAREAREEYREEHDRDS